MKGQIITMTRHRVKAAVELAQQLWEKEQDHGLYEEYKTVPESENETILLYKLDGETIGFVHNVCEARLCGRSRTGTDGIR